VRIVHIPTGTVAQCQTERSQIQNKERAMEILSAKLVMLMEKQRLDTIENLKEEKTSMAFGSQDRSFTLHPYTLVKDHRTLVETSNVEAVLDGDLEEFINAGVLYKAKCDQ
jgi:peptide chain release factor 2